MAQVAQDTMGYGAGKKKKNELDLIEKSLWTLHPQDRENTPFGLLDRAAEIGTDEKPGETTYLDEITREAKAERAAQTGQDLDQAIEAAQRGEVVRPPSWAEYETELQDWAVESEQFIEQAAKDSEARDGVWQGLGIYEDYRKRQDASVASFQQKSSQLRNFFDSHRDVYGDENVDGILSALDEGSKRLSAVNILLDEEGKFRSQFLDQDEFDTYQRLSKADQDELKRWNDELGQKLEALDQRMGGYARQTSYDLQNTAGMGVEETMAYFEDQKLKDEYDRTRQTRNRVLSLYYKLDNERKLAELNRDPEALELYQAVGLGTASRADRESAIQALAGMGYDYNRLAQYQQTQEDAARYAEQQSQIADEASKHPWISTGVSILASPFQGLNYMDQAIRALTNGSQNDIENYVPLNPYNMGATNYVSGVQGTIAEVLEKKHPNAELFGVNVPSFAYQTGTSILNSGYQVALMGPASIAAMGGAAAANEMQDIIARGGNNQQALLGGTAAGIAEMLFEKVSVDQLLKPKSVDGWKALAKETAKQAGVEASEEIFTEIANIVSDAAIMGRDSRSALAEREYMLGGDSREEAKKKVFLGNIKEVALSGIGGALSGGVMGGFSGALNIGQNRSTGRYLSGLGNDVVLDVINEGLESPEGTRSYELAKRIQDKLNAGKTPGGAEIGALYQSNIEQIEAERAAAEEQHEDAQEADEFGSPLVRPTWDTDAILRQTAQEMDQETAQSDAQAMRRTQVENITASAQKTQEPSRSTAQDIQRNGPQESPPALRATPPLTRGPEGRSTQRAGADTGARQTRLAMENASALVKASETFGENGQKAFATAWDEQGDSARYYAGFSAWYQAGLNGKPESQVRGPYARAINEAQRIAAYDSGKRDAALSLEKERAAAPYAKTAGDEAGLVYDEYVSEVVERGGTGEEENAGGITKRTAEQINAAARALGVRVRMVDNVAEGRANGQYNRSDILIAKDASDPVAQVFGHEITHRVQELSPGQYRVFRQAAIDNLADRAVQAKLDNYRNHGDAILYEAAMDDVAADYAGQLLEDGAVLDQFIERHRTDRTLLERLRDVFRGLWQKLTGAERQKAQTAEGKLAAALDAAAEQAKSLTETGEGRGAEESDAAQYSLKGTTITKSYNQLLRENDALRERVEYWRGQTRTTKEITTDKKSVDAAAKALVKEYGAQMDAGGLSQRLQSLYDSMASGRDGQNEIGPTYAWEQAEQIARDIAGSAVEEWSLSEEFPGLKDKLRDTPITIGREYDGDIRNENFRREYRGKLNLSDQGATNVDAVYSELSESYPGLFPEDITHPADQLEQIMDVADNLHTVERQGRFSGQMEEAVTGITNEIVEQFFDLPQTRATMADRYEAKLDQARAHGKQRVTETREQYQARMQKLRAENQKAVQNAIAKEREARERQIAGLKDKYKAKTEAGLERQKASDLRGKITRHARKLSDKLLRPTDKAHIPEELRGPVAKVLESINLESQYTVDPETGKRTKSGSGNPVKRTQAFLDLKQKYADINKNGGDIVIDPSLLGSDTDGVQGSFDAVISMGDTPLSAMNSRQLSTVWQVLKSVEHSVSTAGKLLNQGKYQRTAEWAGALQRDTATRRDRRSLTKSHPTIDLENPYTFFSHFGQAGKDMYRTLRNAQDRQQVLTNQVADETSRIVDEKTARKLEKTTHEYTTEGGQKLTLSTAQVMELYELSKRKQAMEHLLTGGIVQPEIRGTKVRRGTDAIHLTANDLADITGTLTAEEKGIADGLQKLTSTVLSDMGNEASMAAYGYKKFTEPDYWPIRSAREGLHSNIEKGGDNSRSIKNIGMAQATVPHANNPVDIGSIFDTFARHTGDMVDYAAWLVPMEDLNRVYNYQYQDGEGGQTGKTVKGLLDAKGGEGAQKYWHDLMEDIQNGIKAKNDSPIGAIASKGVGAFKGAAVGGNIRVIIQQPTAFFRAAAVLNPADMSLGLTKGATKGNGWKKALQYSPIAMRKDAGGFDISAPSTMKETLFGGKNAVQKVNDALSWGAGKADAVTWGKLWNACEWQVARQRKELKMGSKAFYEEVNRVFTDMIDQTQVVDGILQRSNIMRSSNAMVQQATSFMGEPIMSLNLTMRAWDQLRNEQDTKKRGKAIRNLGRAATALTVTAAVNALAQSLIDGLRDDSKDKKYWDRFWSAFNGQEGDEGTNWEKAIAFILNGNMGQGLNPVGQIPYAKDVLSIIQGYDVSRTELSVIEDLIEAGQTFVKSADGTGPRTIPYALNKLISSAAKMYGIPAANLERDVWAAARSVVTETGNLPLQYEMEKAIYNIGSEKNKSRFEDIMYRALEAGDIDTYTHIQGELMEQMGLNGKEIESAMQSRYKANLKGDPSYTLDDAFYDLLGIRPQVSGSDDSGSAFGPGDLDASSYQAYAAQRAEDYRTAKNALSSSPIFKGMDQETQDAVLRAAYDLAQSGAMMDNGGGEYEYPSSWLAQAPDVEAHGIEPWEYALWRGAQSSIADTKGADGKTVKGESKKDHLADWLEDSGLSSAQQEYLWGTAYTTDYDEYRNELAEYRAYGPQMDAVYRDMSSGLESNQIFVGMDAELREKVTDAAMKASKQMAKMDALEDYEYETQWISKTGEAEDQGIAPEDYVMWHVVCGNTYSDRDANGDEIPGQRKQDHLRAWLLGNDALTESQKLWLWRQQYESLPF